MKPCCYGAHWAQPPQPLLVLVVLIYMLLCLPWAKEAAIGEALRGLVYLHHEPMMEYAVKHWSDGVN